MQKVFLLLIIVIYCILNLCGVYYDGITMDEPNYVGAGHAIVQYGTIHINAFHPILTKWIMGLGTAWIPSVEPQGEVLEQSMYLRLTYPWLWLGMNVPQVLDLVRAARIAVVIFNTLLVACALREVARHFSLNAAAAFGTVLLFSPLFLAHSRLATLDVTCTLLSFIAALAVVEMLSSRTWGRFVYAWFWVLLAYLSNFQALALIPAGVLLVCVTSYDRPRELLAKGALVLFLNLAVFVSINALYSRLLVHSPFWFQTIYQERLAREGPKIFDRVITGMTPYRSLNGIRWYLTGAFCTSNLKNLQHTKTVLLAGEVYRGSRSIYFPFLFFFKETIPSLLLLFGSILAFVYYGFSLFAPLREKGPLVGQSILFGIFFFITYAVAAVNAGINLGLRHVLPVYPFLVLVVTLLLSPWYRHLRAVIIGLVAWHVVAVVSSFPHMLSYFNSLADVFYPGTLVAGDSNFDWGQDNLALHKRLRQLEVSQVYAMAGGSVPLQWYGPEVQYQPLDMYRLKELPQGAMVALSRQYLEYQKKWQGTGMSDAEYYRELGLQLVEQVGVTVLLFKK